MNVYLLNLGELRSGAGWGNLRWAGKKWAANDEDSAARTDYLSETGLDAEPPKLLRTVMFSGFVCQGNEALKRPLPLFFKVPTKAPDAVT
jgi:hypothetical protein